LRPSANSHVFDSSAALAILLDEPRRAEFDDHLDSAAISAVNLAEVATKLIDRGVTPVAMQGALGRLGFDVVALDGELAIQAALLRNATRRFGLSLGDRACLALARHLKLPVVTADRAWQDLDVGVEVLLIR